MNNNEQMSENCILVLVKFFIYTNKSSVCYPMTYISCVPQIYLQVTKNHGELRIFDVQIFKIY